MEIDDGLRNRVVGAIVVTILAMIFLPMLLNEPKEEGQEISELKIPEQPKDSPSLTATILPDNTEDVVAEDEPVSNTNELSADEIAAENPRLDETPTIIQDPLTTAAEKQTTEPQKNSYQQPPSISEATIAKAKKLEPPRLDQPPRLNDSSKNVEQTGRWFIQVASFSDQANAISFRDKLRKQGFPATVDSVWSKNKHIFRLRVGPELNRQRAELISNKLNQLNNVKSIIVSD